MGVESRGQFYERTGALRDMVPNHLFQLLAMIGMEPPVSFSANDVRAKKTELFRAIHPIAPDDAVRGQYGAGEVLGKAVRDYRHEPNVASDSADRDLRRAPARDRQLALGGRALLSAHRQIPGGTQHRDRHPVPAGALRPVPRDADRAAAPQHPHAAHPARRGSVVQLQRQEAWPGDRDRRRRDGLLVPRLFCAALCRRLRNADLRLPDRRCHAVPARRYGRGGLVRRAAHLSMPGPPDPPAIFRTTRQGARGRRRQIGCSRAMAHAWLPIGAGSPRRERR